MFELNWEYVEQGKKELRNARLFSAPKVQNDEFVVSHDFKKCKEYAFYHEKYVYKGKKGCTWGDMTELEMSEIMETVYAQENYKEINQVLRRISIDSDELHIISNDYNEIWDHVYYMLVECLKNRAILGETDNLYEKMFQAYLSGGWPCGWKGKHPQGKLIVYYPKE